MYQYVMVETLSGTLYAISGGNVYNVMLHVNAATLRGLRVGSHVVFAWIYCTDVRIHCTDILIECR